MSETQTLRQPTTGQPAPQNPAAVAAPPKKRKIVLPILLLAGVGIGGTLGWNYWDHGRFMVSTDDAYVRADITQIAAKVSGYVTELPINENVFVKAGTLLARIDAGDYKLAREAVLGKIASQQATVDRLETQKTVQQAVIAQAQAQIASAMAETRRTSTDYQRYFQLAKQGTISQQRAETALSDRDRATAALRSSQAALVSAEAAIGVLDAQKVEAIRQLEQLSTDVAKADRDIGFTELRAPVDGIVGNRGVELGGYVNAGGRIAALVATESLHVEANLKETQVRDIKVGQAVRIHVDALPDHDIIGRVESVAPASGATFSLLPPENATGNFTKIVQRVPIRVALPHNPETMAALRAGLSVVIEIDKRDAGDVKALAQLAQH